MSKIEVITTERLDQLVDEGKEDVLKYFDLENTRRGSAGTKRINIDMPEEFLADLDREAVRRGITRQSLIKVWLYDRLHGPGTISSRGMVEQMISTLPKKYKRTRESLISALTGKREPTNIIDLVEKLETLVSQLEESKIQVTKNVRATKHLQSS